MTTDVPNPETALHVRAAHFEEIPALARLWHDGWTEAHAGLLPEALARTRTLESFKERLATALPDTRVAARERTPLGLCILKGDELNQLYVSAEARGIGVARALIADAESRLAAKGVETAWLACAIGNERAARFYERNGWRLAGTPFVRLETTEGPFDLKIWRYEKRLHQSLGRRA
jgi:GNAT superfamily N-acetyltransferase